jgi:anti-anti-sigma factor
MTNSVTAIPLGGGAMDQGIFALADEPGGFGAASTLASQQIGLLAAQHAGPESDRRMEDWIASQLDLSMDVERTTSPRNIWNQLIDKLPMARRGPARRAIRGGPETSFADWRRFRVAYRRGITVVRLIDRALVRERHVRELTRDLIDLIDAGNHRVILNFQGVERVGSWVALAVDEAYRRAKAADGGELKVCGLSEPLAAVLDIAGMAPGIELHPDENAALGAPWPEPSSPRTLPVDILLALASGKERPAVRGPVPRSPFAGGPPPERKTSRRPRSGQTADGHGEPGLWLIVQMGASKGRPVPVVGPRFVIGRQRECQLRLGSPMVSKLHAAIERREGRTILTDLGSTNGTVLNGRPLRGKEAEIHDGDRIQVGPVVCTVATVAHRGGPVKVEEQVAEWLHGDDAAAHQDPVNTLDTAVLVGTSSAAAEGEREWNCKSEIIQDVLVVTPETGELENDSTIEQLREHLHGLLSEAVPRRVVVNLEYVAHLTGQAIGVLLAHHLRLDQAGGCLRICQARARIMAVLHQVRLTMLIECHPTLDEAVLSAWPGATRRGPSGS